jgi:hypothetical protein
MLWPLFSAIFANFSVKQLAFVLKPDVNGQFLMKLAVV